MRQSHIKKNISYSYEMFLWLFFNKSINPFPSDVRSYPKGTVLLMSCAYISGSDNFRLYSFSHCLMSKASAPATCGVAMEVPLSTAYFPSGYVDNISSPGATDQFLDLNY